MLLLCAIIDMERDLESITEEILGNWQLWFLLSSQLATAVAAPLYFERINHRNKLPTTTAIRNSLGLF